MSILLWFILAADLLLISMLIFGWHSFGRITRRLMIGLIVVIFPVLGAVPANVHTIESMKNVDFCLRCHTMEKHGDSLKSEDEEIVAAVHWANNYVPKEKACYTCHTDYDLFGGVRAKLSGLKHLWVYYFTTPPKPEEIKTYKPYDVNNCLYCHAESKRFRAKKNHNKEPGYLEKILSGEKGCLVAGCHDIAHGVREAAEDAEEPETVASPSAEGAKPSADE
ncbi:MAG: NapC/NirT family cytochrome c [Oligoflexia bacterium]|nr:NapC/NirT family cytochrome c [Oligoflexia bacterium]